MSLSFWGRAIRLAVPFVVWIPIDFLIDGGRTINDFIDVLVRLYRDPSDGGLWFLWVLFLCCVILFVIENINARIYTTFFRNRNRFSEIKDYFIEFSVVIAELLILGAVWAVTNFTTVFGLRLCCKEIIFFLAGFCFCKYCHTKEANKSLHGNKWKKFFCFAFPCMVIFWDRTHFVTFYETLNRWTECNGALRLIIMALEVAYYYSVSFVGIGFIWNLIKKIVNTNFKNKLAYIGNYTIEIYILHTYFLSIVLIIK